MVTELEQAVEQAGITASSKHLCLDCADKKFPRDKWSVTLHYNGKSETFNYSTGIGHRVKAAMVKKEGPEKWSWGGQVAFSYKEAAEAGMLKKVDPKAADVLCCALLDSSACDVDFDSWCADFGYDNDSRKALATYLACQESGRKLRALLGTALIEDLRNKEH